MKEKWCGVMVLLVAAFLFLHVSTETFAQEIGPLPKVPIPAHNLDYEAKIRLGKALFFDKRLSGDNSTACASCHQQEKGWADGLPRAIGLKNKELGRHSPTIFNVAFNDFLFWDGRAFSLEEQAIRPIPNVDEMNQDLGDLVTELSAIPGYVRMFQEAFGTGVSVQEVGQAMAAFMRTVISTDSPFDKFMSGEKKAMGEAAQRGMGLFTGKARCTLCHLGPNFSDNRFHNIGVPAVGPLKEDMGRFTVTQVERDRGAFKTPTLRSIAETAPYMHNGAFKSLEEVVEFYNKGGGEPVVGKKDGLLQPLKLTEPEKKDLIEFLTALTGEKVAFVPPTLP